MNLRSAVKAIIPKSLFRKIEPAGHLMEAVLFNTLSGGSPAKDMQVIGVTGTNGKTTTCFLIHKMLTEAGYNAGLMTTVAYGVGNDIRPQVKHMTNVPVPELIKRLKRMKKRGADWLVLEVTSHALAQYRVWSIPFSVAAMTNVTHEHLDYHGTFKNYLSAKRKLFRLADNNDHGLRIGVINGDDPSAKAFASDIAVPIIYGVKHGDIKAKNVQTTPEGSRFTAKGPEEEYDIVCNLPGSFNVYNALAAVSVGRAIGLDKKQIEQGISALRSVEGRMTKVEAGQDFSVIVDFAHTPDSFEKLFRDIKPMVKGKLIAMFGSAGRRDEAKRVVQGELAGKYCDEVVITEEDDRDIDGTEIMNQIAGGAEKAGKTRDKNLFLVHNREEAIKFTLSRAKKGDTVLLLGKGHEKTIERADGEHPWDEVALATKILRDET